MSQGRTKTLRVSPSRGSNVGMESGLSSRRRSRQKEGKPPITPNTAPLNPIDLMYLDREVLSENLKQTNQLMQQHREEGNVRQIRHEQRRRKFMRQLDTSLISQTNKFFEQEVIGQLLNVSHTEQEELNFRSDVYHYKDIIMFNRRNRDKLIDEMNQLTDHRLIAWESIEAKREVGWVVKLDTRSQLKRRDTLQTASKSANRFEATEIVSEFIQKLLDVVDWTINCREIGGFSYRYADPVKVQANNPNMELTTTFLPELLWNDIRRLASSHHPFACPLPYLVQILPTTLLLPFNISQRPHLADADWILTNQFNGSYVFDQPNTLVPFGSNGIEEGTQNTPQLSAFLAKQDWIDFISSLQTFHENQKKSEEFEEIQYPDFFRDALLTPSWIFQTDPQYTTGEAIIQIRTVVNPIPEPPTPNVDFSSMSLKVALFGASENSRKLVSKRLASWLPRFHVISMDALVLKAFNTVLPTDKLEEEYSPYEQLVRDIQTSLKNGESIQNHQYAQLFLQEVNSLPKPNNGFVVEDYPNTKEQLLSLLQATSNIRYDEHRPQPKDYQSFYTPLHPSKEDWMFDIKSCGFDFLLCCDSLFDPEEDGGVTNKSSKGIEIPLREKVRARLNLYTQEVVYLTEETSSVKGLQYLYDPSRPYATSGLSLTMLEREVKELLEICQKVKLLQLVPYEQFPTPDEAVEACIQLLTDLCVDSDKLSEQYWIDLDEQKRLQEEAAAAEALKAQLEQEKAERARLAVEEAEKNDETAEVINPEVEKGPDSTKASRPLTANTNQPSVEAIIEPENPSTAVETVQEVVEKRLPIIEQNQIPLKLATILSNFWNESEKHAEINGEKYFTTLRDIRYQIIQRRRITMDTIYISMLRQDSRQELFNTFRDSFNNIIIESDLRYDPDCIAELYLRTLQLRNEISKLCEQRYQDVLSIINKTEKDGQNHVFIYHLKCEGMFLLQNEMNRFYQILDLLFDYTKSIQTYQIHEKIANELEVLLPSTSYELIKVETTGKKGDAKAEKKLEKSKTAGAAVFAPYREVLSPYFINLNLNQLTESIPLAKDEEVVDPKAKPKPAGKDKNNEGVIADPFVDVMKVVQEEINKWKEGAFVLSRDLYGGNNKDERLCQAIEQCVWFEAAKVELSCQMIQKNLADHVQWIEEMENQTFIMLREIAYDRFLLELASGEELIDIIEQCIQQARPLHSLWLVSPDAMPVIDPETIWYRFQSYLSNEELERFDDFGGIPHEHRHLSNADRLLISNSEDAAFFEEIPVSFDPNHPNAHLGRAGQQSHRPFSSPGGIMNGHYQNVTRRSMSANANRVQSDDSMDPYLSNIPNQRGLNVLTAVSTDYNNPQQALMKQRSPKIRKQDEISNYNYIKKLMPPAHYHQVQKEAYLASQGRLSVKDPSGGRASPNHLSPTIAAGGGGVVPSDDINEVGGRGESSMDTSDAGRSNYSSGHGYASGHGGNGHTNNRNGGQRGGTKSSHSHSRQGGGASGSRGHSGHGHGHGGGHSAGHKRKPSSAHGSHPHSAGHHGHERPSSSSMDPKEYEKYQHERHLLEEKLMLRRELREKEFVAMGMSVPSAKLAAYNDLLLEEQHAWNDFDSHYKRMHRDNSPSTPH